MGDAVTDSLWFWANDEDAERWNGGRETREEALGEALEESDQDASVWVARGYIATPERIAALVNETEIDNLLDRLHEYAYYGGLLGEDADIECSDPQEAVNDLRALVAQHFRTASTWYAIGEEKERVR